MNDPLPWLVSRLRRIVASYDASDDCWNWPHGVDHHGYGRIQFTDETGKHTVGAHRAVYMLLAGPIPDGLTLDHLCRNRRCVNPEHLEPVTIGENVRRGNGGRTSALLQRAKTHCPRGHGYDAENTRVTARGWRICRACDRDRRRLERAA